MFHQVSYANTQLNGAFHLFYRRLCVYVTRQVDRYVIDAIEFRIVNLQYMLLHTQLI